MFDDIVFSSPEVMSVLVRGVLVIGRPMLSLSLGARQMCQLIVFTYLPVYYCLPVYRLRLNIPAGEIENGIREEEKHGVGFYGIECRWTVDSKTKKSLIDDCRIVTLVERSLIREVQ
jgi:hypothetical protein